MITRTFVEEIKHIITWFVNVYGQYDDLFFSVRGFGHPVFLKPHFGHPVMKTPWGRIWSLKAGGLLIEGHLTYNVGPGKMQMWSLNRGGRAGLIVNVYNVFRKAVRFICAWFTKPTYNLWSAILSATSPESTITRTLNIDMSGFVSETLPGTWP